MKTSSKVAEVKGFKPVEVAITIESEEELDSLIVVAYYPTGHHGAREAIDDAPGYKEKVSLPSVKTVACQLYDALRYTRRKAGVE